MTRLREAVLDRVGHGRAGRVILVAALVGLVLRLVATAFLARSPHGLYDPSRYIGYARGIADGQGLVDPFVFHVTAYFPPGYPYLLGGLYWAARLVGLEGSFPIVVGVAQSFVGAAGVVLTGILGRRTVGAAAGAVGAAIVAVLPNLIVHASVVLSETVAVTVMLAFLVLAWPEDPTTMSRGRALGAGAALGVLLLVRPVTAGVLGAVVVGWLLARVPWRTVLVRTVLVAGIGLLCLAPWTIRNAIRMDAFVPLSTNTGDNLCMGHAPGSAGAFRYLAACEVEASITDGTAGEVEADQQRRELALRHIRDDWGRQPRLVWLRLETTLGSDHDGIYASESYFEDLWLDEGVRNVIVRASDWSWAVVGVVGLVGVGRALWTRRPGPVVLVVIAAAVLAAPLLTFGDSRFKIPLVPVVALLAGWVVVDGVRAVRRS